MFVGARIKDVFWPEILGITAYAGTQLIGATIDSKWQPIKTAQGAYPLTQTIFTVGTIGASMWAIGNGKAVDLSKGMLYGATIGIVINLITGLYEMAKSGTTMKIKQLAALIPTSVGVLPPPVTTTRVPAAARVAAGVVPLRFE